MPVQLTNEMIKGAQETERITGVPASITLAQIIEESSGKYEGGLSYLAYKGNNLFGVKSFNPNDERIFVANSEGNIAWRKYDSQYDSIVDHARILGLDRYSSLYKDATSVSDYAQALQDGGYAGNSTTYASHLMSHVNNYDLNQYNLNNSSNTNGTTGVDSQVVGSGSNTHVSSSGNTYGGNGGKIPVNSGSNTHVSSSGNTYGGSGGKIPESSGSGLGIIGSIIKYLAILLLVIIGVFFILKSLKIEVI